VCLRRAESKDGVHREKFDSGQVEFEGLKANILFQVESAYTGPSCLGTLYASRFLQLGRLHFKVSRTLSSRRSTALRSRFLAIVPSFFQKGRNWLAPKR
jgi:hypothetical protein